MNRGLSLVEVRVLRMIAEGYQSKEIASALVRSKATVEHYVRFLMAKYGARSRAHLVALAICDGSIPVDQLRAGTFPLSDGTRADGGTPRLPVTAAFSSYS